MRVIRLSVSNTSLEKLVIKVLSSFIKEQGKTYETFLF